MKGWVIVAEGDTLSLARRHPIRWDVSVTASLVANAPARALLHGIRRDLWRALQTQRGFSPAVALKPVQGRFLIRAGGSVDGVFPRHVLESRTAEMLQSRHRATLESVTL